MSGIEIRFQHGSHQHNHVIYSNYKGSQSNAGLSNDG